MAQATTSGAWSATARVDWITYTAPRGEADGRFETLGRDLLQSAAGRGGIDREAGAQGYRGRKAAGTFVGERYDGWMITLSGDDAAGAWHRLRGLPGHPTRLDLAVTALAPQRAPRYVEAAYRARLEAPKDYNAPRRSRLIQEDTGGATLYVGAPKSARIVRLYDHGHRHGYDEPGGAFRWELQLRKNYAEAHWKLLDGAELLDLAIAGAVRAATLDCVLPCPWSAEAMSVTPRHRGTTDVDGKLEWLRSAVAPTVATLSRLGYYDEMLTALGLSDTI